MIIDLFGLPGSGKSTLAESVASFLNNNEILCFKMNGTEWGGQRKSGIMHKLGVFFSSLKYISLLKDNISFLKSSGSLCKDGVYRSVLIVLYLGQIDVVLRDKRTDRVYISDNGLFQSVLSLLYNVSESNCANLDKLLSHYKRILRNKKINFVATICKPTICIERIISRSKKIRISTLSSDDQIAALLYLDRMIDKIDSLCMDGNVLRVNTGEIVDEDIIKTIVANG